MTGNVILNEAQRNEESREFCITLQNIRLSLNSEYWILLPTSRGRMTIE